MGLRAKCYSFITVDVKHEGKKAAGVRTSVKKRLLHEKYLNVLQDNSLITVKQCTIVSKKQRLYSVEQTRIALSAMDIKRYILDDGVTTLPYGHYSIR